MNTQFSDILELSVSERIQLVEDIWDSIAAVPDALSLSDDQKLELNRRVESYRANPNDGISWGDLKSRLGHR